MSRPYEPQILGLWLEMALSPAYSGNRSYTNVYMLYLCIYAIPMYVCYTYVYMLYLCIYICYTYVCMLYLRMYAIPTYVCYTYVCMLYLCTVCMLYLRMYAIPTYVCYTYICMLYLSMYVIPMYVHCVERVQPGVCSYECFLSGVLAKPSWLGL